MSSGIADGPAMKTKIVNGSETGVQGPRDGEIDRDTSLHIAGAPAVYGAVADGAGERIAVGPLGQIARGHDIGVALEDECRWLVRVAGGGADQAIALAALGLSAGKLGVRVQGVEVEAPKVGFQPDLLESARQCCCSDSTSVPVTLGARTRATRSATSRSSSRASRAWRWCAVRGAGGIRRSLGNRRIKRFRAPAAGR